MANINSGATRHLFITPQYVRENHLPNENTEGNLIAKAIRVAQDKYIRTLIGGDMYSALINNDVLGTLSVDYINLLNNFVIPCLVEYTIYEYVMYSYKIRNKGISRQTSPDSIPAELEDLYYMRDNIRDTAQMYGEMLITELRVNSIKYPDFLLNTPGQTAAGTGDYFGGIHIPGANRGPGCGPDGRPYYTNNPYNTNN